MERNDLKLFKYILVTCIFIVNFVYADGQRVAFIDVEKAIVNSDAAKRYEKEAESQFAPRIKQLNALQAELKTLEEHLHKDGPTLTQVQLESRRLELRRKFEDLKLQDQQLQQDKAISDQAELAKLQPKLEEATKAVMESENIDIVMHHRAAFIVNPEDDVTSKVIDRLNKMK